MSISAMERIQVCVRVRDCAMGVWCTKWPAFMSISAMERIQVCVCMWGGRGSIGGCTGGKVKMHSCDVHACTVAYTHKYT